MSLVPFDDRDGWIWLDGQFTPWREAKVHVLTHGLHYASAVFEGERCYDGKIFKGHEHSLRLLESGRLLDMPIPYTAEQIDARIREVEQGPDGALYVVSLSDNLIYRISPSP